MGPISALPRRPAGDGASHPGSRALLLIVQERYCTTLRSQGTSSDIVRLIGVRRKRFKAGKHHVIRAGSGSCSAAAASANTNESALVDAVSDVLTTTCYRFSWVAHRDILRCRTNSVAIGEMDIAFVASCR